MNKYEVSVNGTVIYTRKTHREYAFAVAYHFPKTGKWKVKMSANPMKPKEIYSKDTYSMYVAQVKKI
jgi:hypothetical protein